MIKKIEYTRKLQRNHACGCKSGLKFKNCCLKTRGKRPKVTYTFEQS